LNKVKPQSFVILNQRVTNEHWGEKGGKLGKRRRDPERVGVLKRKSEKRTARKSGRKTGVTGRDRRRKRQRPNLQSP